MMKAISFLGDSLAVIRECPSDVRQDIGFQSDTSCYSKEPEDEH